MSGLLLLPLAAPIHPSRARRVAGLAAVPIVLLALTSASAQVRAPHGRLFPPEDLGLLEGPDRDAWQRPDHVMDVLGIADGSRVADVGAGGGWFTIRLARRVGPNGLVYAEDIQRQMIDSIERRLQREGLKNIRTVLGTAEDPRLPIGQLDVVLIVDTYQEVETKTVLLERVRDALKPGGRLGIVEFKLEGSGPGPSIENRVAPSLVIGHAESAGFRLQAQDTSLPYHYLLVFVKAEKAPTQP